MVPLDHANSGATRSPPRTPGFRGLPRRPAQYSGENSGCRTRRGTGSFPHLTSPASGRPQLHADPSSRVDSQVTCSRQYSVPAAGVAILLGGMAEDSLIDFDQTSGGNEAICWNARRRWRPWPRSFCRCSAAKPLANEANVLPAASSPGDSPVGRLGHSSRTTCRGTDRPRRLRHRRPVHDSSKQASLAASSGSRVTG